MRIALDTNVLISAYTARGLSSDVYRFVLAEHDFVISKTVLDEFDRILADKFGAPKAMVAEFVEELSLHEVISASDIPSHLNVIRDPDDRIVVAEAILGNADRLITGDKDILDVSDQIPELIAQTPREFWESVRKSS